MRGGPSELAEKHVHRLGSQGQFYGQTWTLNYGHSKIFYRIRGAIEATFYSASTKYVLLYQGKRYDTVTAEYV